jgi:replicative DNA helicase
MRLFGVNAEQKLVVGLLQEARCRGIKPTYTLTTRTGKCITGTADHPVLTDSGWKVLGELSETDLVATPLRLPQHGMEITSRARLCRLLGYMAGNGTALRHREVGLIIPDDAAFADAVGIVREQWPEISVNERQPQYHTVSFSRVFENGWGKPFGNPMREWLRSVDAFGCRDSAKRVPRWVFEAGVVGARSFLAGYLATDGCVKRDRSGRWTVHFDTTSRGLAQDVQRLALRLGIILSISPPAMNSLSVKPIYRVSVGERENLRRCAQLIEVCGRRGEKLKAMAAELPDGHSTSYIDGLPTRVSEHASKVSRWKHQGKRMRRRACQELAATTGDAELNRWAQGELVWEDLRALERSGDVAVWSIKVTGVDSFLASGIVAKADETA